MPHAAPTVTCRSQSGLNQVSMYPRSISSFRMHSSGSGSVCLLLCLRLLSDDVRCGATTDCNKTTYSECRGTLFRNIERDRLGGAMPCVNIENSN